MKRPKDARDYRLVVTNPLIRLVLSYPGIDPGGYTSADKTAGTELKIEIPVNSSGEWNRTLRMDVEITLASLSPP